MAEWVSLVFSTLETKCHDSAVTSRDVSLL